MNVGDGPEAGITPPDGDQVREVLRGVVDPELGDNIVDLGMLRSVAVGPDGDVEVEVALTIASCPLRTQIRNDVTARVQALRGVRSVEVRTGEMTGPERERLMAQARWRAREKAPPTQVPPTARVIAMASGKGGVGKSSIAVAVAIAIARQGHVVGLLDADIWGFSVPRLLGITGQVEARDGKMIPVELPVGPGRLKIISMGFLADERRAIMWRGLLLNRAVQQFVEDVSWGDLDYLIFDMPPGTGDVQMGLARLLPRTEVLIVTTPQQAASTVAARVADMARKGYLRVAGVIENMSVFTCDHGTSYALFGEGGGQRLAEDIGVPLLATLPFEPSALDRPDGGDLAQIAASGRYGDAVDALAKRITSEIAPVVEMTGCTARMISRVEAALDKAGR